MDISLILNSGVQFHQAEEELTIDLGSSIIKPLRFFEFQIKETTYLDPVYYFAMEDKYVKRNDLVCAGYLDPVSNEMAPSEEINFGILNSLDDSKIMSVGRMNQIIGDKRMTGLSMLENEWMPLPLFEKDITGSTNYPTNWCRVKLIPNLDKTTEQKKVYKVVFAFDTQENLAESDTNSSPRFEGQPFKRYTLCGISREYISQLSQIEQNKIETMDIPMKIFSYCDVNERGWINEHLQRVFHSQNLSILPEGQRLKYLVYYIFFVCTLHKSGIVPEVKLYSDKELPRINTNLVLDIGNSRTFGLVAEDPLNTSFSKSSSLELRDLQTGDIYNEPFDMRLCFKEERFGIESSSGQFRWPSILRLGKEALRTIYEDSENLRSVNQFDTNYSSPKRYLWDKEAYAGQWKFISEQGRVMGPTHSVFIEGLMQQFRSDGSFTPNPQEMGGQSSFSRSSLMTFCFIEILLHARMQINSIKFRTKSGEEGRKREISRVILTCPTAMSKEEQIILRQSMEEATIVLRRYFDKSYNIPYISEYDTNKIEIIPSVRDLKRSLEDVDLRRSWNYDEATCCQMVYLYSELRRYLGNTSEFFSMYGKRRNGEQKPSLTIASIDIGAGTSDLMICNYKDSGESIMPTPLFWESFHLAGDDLIKRIISDVIIESPRPDYPHSSGLITAKLREMGCTDTAVRLHHFFGDTNTMGVIERRMRKEFSVQVMIPMANYLLSLLHQDKDDCDITFDEIFSNGKPSAELMDFFAEQFGFRFEELHIRYSKNYLNEIIRRVFEISLRKWAAIFYTYKCDIVLLGGRPCSLKEIQSLVRRLMPVSPNRLISMNDYRVGSWYPGATDTGHFNDKKSLVAVGALIAYLAESGKLPMFKMNIDNLKKKIQSTTEYIGIMNPHTGIINNVLTPSVNLDTAEISGFPTYFGSKQLNVEGYPAQLLYVLDYDDSKIHSLAVETVIQRTGNAPGTPEKMLPINDILDYKNLIKSRARANAPLRFTFEREYYQDKERVKIESITNSQGETVSPQMFRLRLQSWAENESNWLDSGCFILHIGNNN